MCSLLMCKCDLLLYKHDKPLHNAFNSHVRTKPSEVHRAERLTLETVYFIYDLVLSALQGPVLPFTHNTLSSLTLVKPSSYTRPCGSGCYRSDRISSLLPAVLTLHHNRRPDRFFATVKPRDACTP